jgi:hypothetical protein
VRIAVQIVAAVLVVAAVLLIYRALGAGSGSKMIGLALGGALVVAATGMSVLAWKHRALVEAGEKRGEAVMPLGKMVVGFGTLGAIWLYNLAILAVLIVLIVRLI